MDQTQIINRSVRCFAFGLLSFIPVLGLAMGIIAWIHGFTVLRHRRGQWNPAEPYLHAGRVLGLIGAVASFALFGLILLTIVSANSP